MTDSISSNKPDYPGDKVFTEFLKEHKCPLPIHIVKFRFWGQIVSIAMRVSPNDEIRDMWDNKLPDFESEDQAQQFFDAIFSLWNGLVEINMAGNRLQLSQRHGLDNSDGLKAMIEKRYEELDAGFLSGFS